MPFRQAALSVGDEKVLYDVTNYCVSLSTDQLIL